MSSCPAFDELSALVDGDLTPARELEVRWHLDICATCARYAEAVVTLKRVVGRAHDRDLPLPALRRSVRASLPKRRRSWRWRAGALAAPLLVAASAVLFWAARASSAACEMSLNRECRDVSGMSSPCPRSEERSPALKPF
jgi:anti-sigma factor RsiW